MMRKTFFVVAALASLSCAMEHGDLMTETAESSEEPLGQVTQAQSSQNIRVLTLNVRINETKHNIPNITTRRPRIKQVIQSINPDIIGFQEVEEDFWSALKGDYPAYDGYFWKRGGPPETNPKEGVAILYRKNRFTYRSRDEKTLSYEERVECVTTDFANRNVVRVKLDDNNTGRTLDVFNTHFPLSKECNKNQMATKVANWVEDFGDNVILMGDFNTGYNKYGGRGEAYNKLLSKSSVQLFNAYKSVHSVSLWDPFITNKANTPEKRIGDMIDHIMFGPAYNVYNAGIDRSVFVNGQRIDCDDAHSAYESYYMNGLPVSERTACALPYFPYIALIDTVDSYSDHWAVWADLRRIDCPNGC
jgi:endonuclease/exonuclease/phosphatase family metal-dependent hydrolase